MFNKLLFQYILSFYVPMKIKENNANGYASY